MRSNVTPGTNLALFCIQNLKNKQKKQNMEKLLIRVIKQTRRVHRLDKAIKIFGFNITDFTTYE